MPTYEYRCDACQNDVEVFQPIKDKPLKKCPACGKNKLRRLISGGAGIVFKGSGFYQTDYRNDSYESAVKADAPLPKKDKDSTAHASTCSCCSVAKHCNK